MATAEGSACRGRARFAAACGVLSRYVKAAALAVPEAEAEARPAAGAVAALLPLMPGADVPAQEDHEAGPSPAPLTIFYGGRVVVLEDVSADRAAELLRLAATAAAEAAAEVAARPGQVVPPAADDDLPMARKASLQRFMEKRRSRVAARAAPYRRPNGGADCPDSLALTL
ncbi:hypothetical protein ACP70R_021150 [Stipagrostis hirtigluma subsp. patula]